MNNDIPKYRKKPVIVEALKMSIKNATTVATWCKGMLFDDKQEESGYVIYIDTLEGVMKAKVGDYVIKGVKGEFYPCKSDIFEQTYEMVENGT